MFKTLCVEFKMVSVEYFMEKMEEWEVVEIYNVLKYSNRQLYECSRMIAYFCVMPYMKKKVSMSEFLPLPFDEKEQKKIESKPLTKAQFERLKERQNNIKSRIRKD